MSRRLPGRPSSISSTLRVPPSARVSTSCNTKPIHDPPAGNGPAGHIAPSAHPQSLNTPQQGAGEFAENPLFLNALASRNAYQNLGDPQQIRGLWSAGPGFEMLKARGSALGLAKSHSSRLLPTLSVI